MRSISLYYKYAERIFSGKDRGKELRTEFKLDDEDYEESSVEINVPKSSFGMTSSFFGAMFGPSVRKLGEHKFRAKYLFVGADISRVYEHGIREALRRRIRLRG